MPEPVRLARDLAGLFFAEPKNQFSAMAELLLGPRQEMAVVAERPGCNEVEPAGIQAGIFHAGMENPQAIDFKFSGDFRQERAFFGIRFYESEIKARNRHSEWNSWKTSSRANVGEPTFDDWHARNGEKALSKVKFQDFDWFCDRRQRYGLIPQEQEGYVGPDFGAQNRIRADTVWKQRVSDNRIGYIFHNKLRK